MQTSSDGTQTEVKDVATSSHMLSVDDIGFLISVSCEPIRSDWARGPIVLSEQIGPILPGNANDFHPQFMMIVCSTAQVYEIATFLFCVDK